MLLQENCNENRNFEKNQIVLLKLPEDFPTKEMLQHLFNKPLLRAKVRLTLPDNFYFDLTGLSDRHFDRFNNSFHLGWDKDIELNLPQHCWKFPTIPDLMEYLQITGSIFTIWFIKKDGTERKMNCRFGVKKHLHGGKATVSEDKYWIVCDTVAKEYRAVNKETIFRIKCQGVVYEND